MKGDVSELVLTPDLIRSIRKEYFCLITNDQDILKCLSEHFDVSEYLGYYFAGHEVIINEDCINIGCFEIKKDMLKGLLRLQKNDVVILNGNFIGDIKLKDLDLVRYASNSDITFGHINFYYKGYTVRREEVQKWIE